MENIDSNISSEDVENILLTLIQAADFDIKKAEKGIIYIARGLRNKLLNVD